MSTGTVFRVAKPWAWSWLPPAFIPIRTDPDLEDGPHRYPDRPDWPIVVDAVTAAVRRAEEPITEALTDSVDVVIDADLNSASRRAAQSWLRPAGVEGVWWQYNEHGHRVEIGDGCHRLYAARTSRHRYLGIFGRSEALPLQVDSLLYLPSAVIDYGDEKLRRTMARSLGETLPALASFIRDSWRFYRRNQLLLANIDRALTMVSLGRPMMTKEEHEDLQVREDSS